MSDHRRYPRKNMFFSASLATPTDRSICDILNMSAGGARLRLDDVPADLKNGQLTLTIDDYGDLPVHIVWHDGFYVGIKFDVDPRRMHDQTMAMAIFEQD